MKVIHRPFFEKEAGFENFLRLNFTVIIIITIIIISITIVIIIIIIIIIIYIIIIIIIVIVTIIIIKHFTYEQQGRILELIISALQI